MQENKEVNTASGRRKREREDITSAGRESEELLGLGDLAVDYGGDGYVTVSKVLQLSAPGRREQYPPCNNHLAPASASLAPAQEGHLPPTPGMQHPLDCPHLLPPPCRYLELAHLGHSPPQHRQAECHHPPAAWPSRVGAPLRHRSVRAPERAADRWQPPAAAPGGCGWHCTL